MINTYKSIPGDMATKADLEATRNDFRSRTANIAYCAYKDKFTIKGSIVKDYTNLFVETNELGTPSFSATSGIFTAPVNGLYLVSVFFSADDVEGGGEGITEVYIQLNGERPAYGEIFSGSETKSTFDDDSAGKTITMKLTKGNTVSLFYKKGGNWLQFITFCVLRI